MAHKIKSLQLMLKLNYHHFAVGNVPLFNHPPLERPALHTRIDGTCKFDPLSGPFSRTKKFDLSPKTPSAGVQKSRRARFVASITLTGEPLWGVLRPRP
jgi:hypothetical protein